MKGSAFISLVDNGVSQLVFNNAKFCPILQMFLFQTLPFAVRGIEFIEGCFHQRRIIRNLFSTSRRSLSLHFSTLRPRV